MRQVHDSGSSQLQAKFRSRLKILAQLEFGEWREPLFKPLVGEGDGLSELRFKADNVQQRPLGFVSGPHDVTMLLWAVERGNRFVPRSACVTALERKAAVIAEDRAWRDRKIAQRILTDALWFPLE